MFKLSIKRTASFMGALLLGAATFVGVAQADNYPSKPITIIIPFGAGGSHDMNARVFTSIIPQYLGQAMIVKLMPGASGQKATAYATKAKADGYTLLFTHIFVDQLQPHTENLSYQPLKDLVSVVQLNDSAPLLWVRADKPWKTLKEMLDYGRANPGKLKFSNSGKWGASFTAGAMIFTKAGVQAKFMPYKGGGPSKRAVLAGDADFTFGRPSTVMGQARAGKVRVLAVGGTKPMKILPGVPVLNDMGYGGSGNIMQRILLAQKGIPADRLKTLQDAFGKLQNDKTYKKLMKSLGENRNMVMGPAYDKLRVTQSKKYLKLVKGLTGS
ncbi:MAG: tripartite tricarboxylate transporter substrate binding protein [Rhodospirillales bacterium]|nr:tripartite tricarboxylate transporter substrate binding protein [Rhodospirillales bacterium]